MALKKRLDSVSKWLGTAAVLAGMMLAASPPARADVNVRIFLGPPVGVGVLVAPQHRGYARPYHHAKPRYYHPSARPPPYHLRHGHRSFHHPGHRVRPDFVRPSHRGYAGYGYRPYGKHKR